ncbi:multicopper oxidase-domain-containing protein [Macrophomina phaseolina]|uniref:Multicopper oxidase-domain-containing protein n=1 Tax=Macrophomina phaseolina TaxID=35725 RepID=A0ABQ8GCR9_9PEZI|nr:multicopper oxidase-domain-containing protein [Macrophomina phaseolina]
MKCATLWSYLASVLTVGASARSLTRTLPQHKTNGGSNWGTLDCPKLPDFLTSNPLPGGFPWGDRSGLSNDPYTDVPNTGVTRYYDFSVARGYLAPDGYNKSGIFINGEFPGPAIEANWGDMIEVRVHNNIVGPEEGTAFHWHGITQKGTQWFDGVPGVSQCPIAPGSSFTYRFRADVYGTSWWHSHFSAQYTAGAFGPLIIYGPKHVPYDVDVGPVILGDYYHRDYFDVLEDAASNTTDFNIYVPWSDNNLINGKNNYNCSMVAGNATSFANATSSSNATCFSNAGLAQFRFEPGKVHRLRLMNVGAAALLHFSIDGHKMQVIAHDFEPVVPYEADVITLGAAQRTDILVTADANPNETYWIRSTISLNCSVSHNTNALAVLSYEGNDHIEEPRSRISAAAAAADEKSFLCKNDDLSQTVPFFPKPVAEPDVTETIEVDLFTNATGHHVWIMNNRTQRTNYNEPVLLLANQGNSTFPDEWNVYDFGRNKTIRIVLNTVYQSAHPMHLHGHSFQVLAEGPGAWDGTTITNPSNPARRDTHMQRRYGHLVIQFEADNPGAWSYHCHIAWHASMGYNIEILERGDELAAAGAIPMVMQQTCDDWKEWSGRNVVNQIDAGI